MGEAPGSAAQHAALPPLFARWVDVLLPGPIPAEKNATCDRCAMVAPPDSEDAGELFFSASTKCCTYLPELANFLVGRILADPDPGSVEGRATVELRLDKRLGVSPLGLHRTPVYSLLYRTSPSSFGHARTMRCPHYLEEEGGRCGIWRHRESTCATWFCKFGRGETGRTFWQRLHDVLVIAEDAVRMHCLLENGFDADRLASMFPPRALFALSVRHDGLSPTDVDGEPSPELYAAHWGKWRGRERELFRSCARIAEGLAWPDVLRLGGVRLELLTRLLLQSYDKLTSLDVPQRARHRQLKIVYASSESAQIVGYSNIDPLRVPKSLVDALHFFDGRPTGEALAAIDLENGLRVAPGVVRKLVDFGVLSEEIERENP